MKERKIKYLNTAVLIIAIAFAVVISCDNEIINSILPLRETADGEIPVVAGKPKPAVYSIVIEISGGVPGDTVTVSPDSGYEGSTATLAYTVADTAHYNMLEFSGAADAIVSADSAEDGERTYVINADDSLNGVITISAVFIHTDLMLDPIAFDDDTGYITKTYGDTVFTNAVAAGYSGTGAVTYSSSDTSVAAVDSLGEVTILKTGSAVITAEKEADAVYAYAQKDYTLAVICKPVIITGLSAQDKQYDGTTAATVTGTEVIDGLISGDTVTIVRGTAVFEDGNAGIGKNVIFSGYSLGGDDAGNYILSAQPVSLPADITGKPVAITGLSASSKMYDGTAAAAFSGTAVINGIVGGDTVTVRTGTAAFSDKNAGTGKTVTFSGWSLAGTDAGNYSLSGQPASVTADITEKQLTITGLSVNSKVYDGTTTAAVTGTAVINGIISGDTVTVSAGTAAFADKKTGTGKTVTFSGYSLGGADAGKYTLSAQPANVTADITAKPVTITGLSAGSKVYDGTITAAVAGTAVVNGLISGDTVTVNAGTAAFTNKTAGTGRTVTFNNYSLNGADAGNYNLSAQPANVTADITAKPVIITGLTAGSKVYDGTTTAAVSGIAAINGIVSGDTVTVSAGTASFEDTAAGNSKAVTFSGWSLTGANAGNYILFSQPASVTADITANSVTITGLSAGNKVYDGATTATVSGTAALSGIVSGDTVTVSAGTAAFADKKVGTGKTVTFSGYSLAGADAGNYSLSAQPANVTANITAKALTITGLSAGNKVYDGAAAAAVSGTAALSGVVSGDTVTVKAGTAAFGDKKVGTGKTVTFSGYSLTGTDAGNYSLSAQPANVTANITAKALTITGLSAGNKVYDGATTAAVSGTAALSGVVSGDTVTLGGTRTAVFADKKAGTAKAVTISGYTISGADAGNYSLTQPSLTANITAKALTITGLSAGNKVYDSATTVTITGTAALSGVVSGDTVTLGGTRTAVFADKNAGTGKAVTISGYTISGADAGNYSLTQPSLTANITAKALTITGLSASNKVYNGNTTATITGTAALSGVVSGDTVTLGGTRTAVFADKNVGTGKAVTISGYTITGADAGNYSLTQPSFTANITAKAVTITGLSAANKQYDGTTTATVTGTAVINGKITNDDVNVVAGTAAFANATVSNNKTVTFSGWSLNGADANNYTLSAQPVSVTASINWVDIVSIPAGTFTMGSTESGSYIDERPQHSVTLSSFKMGKYQVTQAQWEAVMGSNPSSFSSNPQAGEIQSKRPVERVSWYDTLVFCNKLSAIEGLSPAYRINGSTDPTVWGTVPTNNNTTWNSVEIVAGSTGYRLPTEAQWEYACRAGTTTAYNTGATISDNTGWYSSNSGSKTHEVGLKPANAFGLYDMHGNVWEWCWDWYGSYSSDAQTDPTGAAAGSYRVERGGSWGNSASSACSSCRGYDDPYYGYIYYGFRLVRP